jgi:hypothetical protein
MVRQAVRDALDRATNRPQDKQHLENYVLNLLGNRRPGPAKAAARPSTGSKALERRVLSTLDGGTATAAKPVKAAAKTVAKATAKPAAKKKPTR